MIDSKPFYLSKTFWFNVICLLVLVAEQIPVISPEIPAWGNQAVAYVLLVGNIVLRLWFTDKPVTLLKSKN